MIKIYTGEHSKALANINADISFPESGISPNEQIKWIQENYNKDITVITFSPYIMNYLNLLLAQNKLIHENIEVYYMMYDEESGEIFENSLLCNDYRTGDWLVNTSDLSDPISNIYSEYNSLRPKF